MDKPELDAMVEEALNSLADAHAGFSYQRLPYTKALAHPILRDLVSKATATSSKQAYSRGYNTGNSRSSKTVGAMFDWAMRKRPDDECLKDIVDAEIVRMDIPATSDVPCPDVKGLVLQVHAILEDVGITEGEERSLIDLIERARKNVACPIEMCGVLPHSCPVCKGSGTVPLAVRDRWVAEQCADWLEQNKDAIVCGREDRSLTDIITDAAVDTRTFADGRFK